MCFENIFFTLLIHHFNEKIIIIIFKMLGLIDIAFGNAICFLHLLELFFYKLL